MSKTFDLSIRTDDVRNAILFHIGLDVPENNVPGDKLAEIDVLDLSSHSISHLESRDFEGLENLRLLDLGDNELKELPEGIFDGLDKLKELNLGSNFLENLPVDVFDKLDCLDNLNLKDNRLKKLDGAIFDKNRYLSELDLSENKLINLSENIFVDNNLKKLDLSYNNLRSCTFNGVFNGLDNLRELDLSYSNLEKIDISAFKGINFLNNLELGGNRLLKFYEEDVFDLIKKGKSEVIGIGD